MLKKILVPLDGSELADRILTHVRRLLLREDAEVMLLSVLPAEAATEDERSRAWRIEEASGHLMGELKKLGQAGARARYDLMTGDPATQILAFADTWQPGLIAMSTHGRTGLERFRRGSVAERVLRGSEHPVLLANPLAFEGQEARFRRVLIPLDGTDASAAILPIAHELASRYEAEVILLHAAAAYTAFAEYPNVEVRPSAEELRDLMEPYRERFDRAGIKARVYILYEDPAQAILHVAAADSVDLVAMTTHGRSGLSRWVFGSVAEKVLRNCPCPVLASRSAAKVPSRAVSVSART